MKFMKKYRANKILAGILIRSASQSNGVCDWVKARP